MGQPFLTGGCRNAGGDGLDVLAEVTAKLMDMVVPGTNSFRPRPDWQPDKAPQKALPRVCDQRKIQGYQVELSFVGKWRAEPR